jgi:hypothetical protein
MEESEKDEGFVVKDRRRFTSEGETKADEVPPKEVPLKEEPAPSEPPRSEAQDRPDEQEALPPLDFASFVLSLANTALFQLGFIRSSETEEVTRDLTAARQTIDLLGLLEEKTRGNLTEVEQKILKESLFQLRMAFVEASRQS